ncbi:BAR-domain-containing protein [Gonapodya prolifera JEL478]|uniref:BAR-domain-containing protein n=1 Tax=Gonapodya prolifera (strain JEL478) TaxID=1344416 RepID=A0A138ZZM5_GONPJ|nr:BAR-domain-containing protein [Gonapodya prolifera JEL478]|eukprot:KXS09954.1 BAR-domain-containing protein [Gonapodya prolifera JEL478]
MSIRGVQKAVSRFPQQLSTRSGRPETTTDPEYVALEERFKEIEAAAQRLHLDAKKFKDAITGSLQSQEKMAELLHEVYQPITGHTPGPNGGADSALSISRRGASPRDVRNTPDQSLNLVADFSEGMKRAREELTGELDLIDRRVIQPCKDFLDLADSVKKYIKKRGHKLLDYDRHREAVRKLQEKRDRTPADEKRLVAAQQEFQQASDECGRVTELLKAELPLFLDLRVRFVDPCFQTLYAVQLNVYRTLAGVFEHLAQSVDQSSTPIVGFQARKPYVDQVVESLTVLKGQWRLVKDEHVGQGEDDDDDPTSPTGSNYSGPPAGNLARANSISAAQQAYAQTKPPSFDAGTQPSSYSSAKLFPAPGVAPMAAAPPPPLPGGRKSYVVALYDFEAQQPGDLSFRKDERIEVVERTSDVNDWWTGKIGVRTGSFPGNYVRDE